MCTSFDYGGYTDWFMPSQDELDFMYKNLAIKGVGRFTGDWYWSSSQTDLVYPALAQNFSDGSQDLHGKDRTYCVRAVRAF